jgi:hypothetical protein
MREPQSADDVASIDGERQSVLLSKRRAASFRCYQLLFPLHELCEALPAGIIK